MARPQKFRHSRETLNDPQIAAKLGGFVLDIETLRAKRKQIDDQIAAAYDAVDDGGFEKKFVRKIIALRAKEEGVRRDEEEGLEAYEIAVEKGVSLACARRDRNLPPHDPETGEITEHEQPETQAEEIHERPSTNDKAYLEAVPQDEASLAGTGSRMLAGREGRSEGEAASADLPTDSNPQPSPTPEADKPEAVSPPADSGVLSDDDVPAFNKRDYVLRPHCLNPSLCAGSGREHCHRCKRAMAESEAA